jgi:putative colanic acid biosynthesis UDP-glucose lipid carrier transferase
LIDIVFSFVSLIGLLLPLLLICVAIKLSGAGPVLVSHKRIGRSGIAFAFLQFRTTRSQKETIATRHSRVTGIGELLEATHLSALPQLFNVLVGDMSLVGPSPDLDITPLQHDWCDNVRNAMRPGITGWAQIHKVDMEMSDPSSARAQLEYDLSYIQNFSVWLDLKTLARAVRF